MRILSLRFIIFIFSLFLNTSNSFANEIEKIPDTYNASTNNALSYFFSLGFDASFNPNDFEYTVDDASSPDSFSYPVSRYISPIFAIGVKYSFISLEAFFKQSFRLSDTVTSSSSSFSLSQGLTESSSSKQTVYNHISSFGLAVDTRVFQIEDKFALYVGIGGGVQYNQHHILNEALIETPNSEISSTLNNAGKDPTYFNFFFDIRGGADFYISNHFLLGAGAKISFSSGEKDIAEYRLKSSLYDEIVIRSVDIEKYNDFMIFLKLTYVLPTEY